MKKFLLLLVSFLLIPAIVHAKPLTLKLATGDTPDSELGVVALEFARYVEEKTNDNVKIQIFFNGGLGNESESLRNVQQGTLSLTVAGIANIVPFEKRLGILTLPYLFSDLDEVVVGTTGKPAEILGKYALDAGFRVLTWTYTDFRYISNSKHPITKIEDIQGLKFRVPQSAVLIAAYSAFGASPTPISWAETFTALQQGVVDGQCYGYIGFEVNKFNEANQKYISEVHYTYQLQPLVVSERIFRKLTAEQQKIFIEAGISAQEKVLAYQKAQGGKAKNSLIAKGVQISKLEDEEKWKKAALDKVWPEMADFVGGKDAINKYLRACGKPEWK